jgi:predicted nucleotide-binding protein (sugar kinase/HSP70/actin superfamily)
MSDHALAVAAAMRAMDVRAEVLPPPDAESMRIGLALCKGRECLPCFIVTGDMLQKCREPGFDPDGAIFFMPTGTGPCRFGQYNVLQSQILADQGFPGVRIASPTTDDSYSLFGDRPGPLRKLAWQAIVAVELLTKVLHEHRPYEVKLGTADETYHECLDDVVESVEAEGGPQLVRAMERVARRFQAVEVDRSQPRPVVGILGEVYVLLNSYSNLALVRQVESAGGEVILGTFTDWLYFVDWRRKTMAFRFGQWGDGVKAMISDAYQHKVERQFARPLKGVLRHPLEGPVADAMELLRPHYDPVLGTEAILTMCRALELGGHGLSGIINVLPFSCMPGTVVATMAPRLRKAMGGIPWLDIAYDGQEETNVMTRLEAFMHQAFQFRQRFVAA